MSNDFIPFAVGGSANVTAQATYAANTTLTQGGFQSGLAKSPDLNKVWRQSSIMSAVLAQFIVDQSGQNAVDDGTTATLEANLLAAIRNATKQRVILTDTGSANAYAAANAVPLTVLPTISGVVQTVQIAHTNTAASTYAPDGLAAKPIFGLGAAALQGGEVVTSGIATLVSYVGPLLNSGALCWVLYECIGGAQQVSPATQPQHAVQLQQVGHGQCRLSVASATSLKLGPYNGNNVIVNGVPLQIPSAGLTISNSGLANSTLYYVYLSGTTASPALVLSATGHSTAPNGIETQTGNTALTLVGMIQTTTGGQFTDMQAFVGVANWFNRRPRSASVSATSAINFTNTTQAELNVGVRVNILTWADQSAWGCVSGSITNNTTLNGVSAIMFINGVASGPVATYSPPTANAPVPFTSYTVASIAAGDGLMIGELWGNVGGGQGSITGEQTILSGMI